MMNESNEFQRGDIWYLDPDPALGREQKKVRPCLILSANMYNNGLSDLLIVIPLTSKKKGIACHIEAKIIGLEQISYIMCDQIRCISKMRLRNAKSKSHPPKRIATVTQKTLDEVERILIILLGFNSQNNSSF